MFHIVSQVLVRRIKIAIYILLVTIWAPKVVVAGDATINWKLDKVTNGVEFYHALQDCGGKNVVFLMLKNKNKFQVKITWQEVFSTQEGPGIKGYSGKKSIELASGELKETSCTNPRNKKLIILPEQVQPTYIASISNFSYSDITVSEKL
ncbi:MAG: hypothetical protein LH478_13345 [Chitinophagaceae bacterium]|nr:hypothetical protein [Chitinophagaceae bacterium]